MKNSISLITKIRIFLICMLAFYAMQPYFFWDKGILHISMSGGVIFLTLIDYSCNKKYNKRYIKNDTIISILLYLCFYIWWQLIFTWINGTSLFLGFVGPLLFDFITIITFLLLDDAEQQYFLKLFTRLLVIICTLSFCFYIPHVLGVKLPSVKIQKQGTEWFYPYFDNYYFFISVFDRRTAGIGFERFQSVFMEPGHLGMMCALLLYANKFKKKSFSTFILLLACLFSLSLAAIILLFAGWVLFIFFSSKKKIRTACILIILAIMSVFASTIYYKNHPESIISMWILGRLTIDKDKGIAGNNRNSANFLIAYEEFKQDGVKLLFGSGTTLKKQFPKNANASYKDFIYEHGLLGLFLLIIFYLSFFNKINKQFGFGMFLLWSLSFIQRPYATWLSQIFIFISALKNYNLNFQSKKTIKEK